MSCCIKKLFSKIYGLINNKNKNKKYNSHNKLEESYNEDENKSKSENKIEINDNEDENEKEESDNEDENKTKSENKIEISDNEDENEIEESDNEDENNNENENNNEDENNNENENIPIKKIEKLEQNIESYTKLTINSPKFPEYEDQKYNYNTFCTFKSIEGIFYLIYIKDGDDIVFYNLIDEKEVIDIKVKYLSDDFHTIEIKYLFDENNQRDLLVTLSRNLILWNVNTFECLFNIKIKSCDVEYAYDRYDHLGIVKLNKSYDIIVNNEEMKIFDLNGNKLKDNYKSYLKFDKYDNISNYDYIDTYYDKKFCKSYIFFNYRSLYVYNYKKRKLYRKFPEIHFIYRHIIVNDDDENLIKLIYLINYDTIGVFNFHSRELLYKINFESIPFENEKLDQHYHYNSIYSVNFWDNNYISLSYGKVFETGVRYGGGGARHSFDKKYHSIEVIDLKEEKMKQVLKLTTIDKLIFGKKIFHPKYGDCMLTQDICGEIKIIQIKLKESLIN